MNYLFVGESDICEELLERVDEIPVEILRANLHKVKKGKKSKKGKDSGDKYPFLKLQSGDTVYNPNEILQILSYVKREHTREHERPRENFSQYSNYSNYNNYLMEGISQGLRSAGDRQIVREDANVDLPDVEIDKKALSESNNLASRRERDSIVKNPKISESSPDNETTNIVEKNSDIAFHEYMESVIGGN